MGHPTKVKSSPPRQNPRSPLSAAFYAPVNLSPTLYQGSSPEVKEENNEDLRGRKPGSFLLQPRVSISGEECSQTRRSEFQSDSFSVESSPSTRGLNGPLKINTSLGGLIRSAMLRQPSSSSSSFGDQTPISSRGTNTTHLRRLLDPWLKPRKVAVGSPGPFLETGSIEGSPNSSSHSSDIEGSTSTSARWVDQEVKQSILRLTWKNGFQLYTFSVNESDILAATRKEEKCSGFSYTFYSVHGEKKKKNSGRKELISSVAGQMSISSGRSSFKEFVVFSPESESSELAAISFGVSEENLKTSGKYPCPSEPNVAVVLPSQVHGKSNSENGGKPSPLLDRWRSGGLCDCGGWDVGCAITVLIDRHQEAKSTAESASHRAELFFQVPA